MFTGLYPSQSLEQSLAEKLQVMENDLELATSESESLLQLQESLKVRDNHALT